MADLVGAPPVTPERLEARYRAVERSIADSNGLDAQERWIDTPLPPGRVRILCTGRQLTELEVGAISWNSTDRVSSIAEDLDLVLRPDVRSGARDLGIRIAEEDGIGRAVDLVETHC